MKLSKPVIALLAVLGVLLLGAVMIFSSISSMQKTMVAKENALNAQYMANQNELSTYIVTIKESLGIADRNTDQLDRVLQDAIKGRYEDKNGAPQGGQMFSAMVEAYPDLKNVSGGYEKVQDAVMSGRSAYKNKQDKLLDMIRDYDTWRSSGLVKPAIIRMIGAPSDHLEARIGEDVYHGQAALDKMKSIVLAKDATDAYKKGELTPLDVNPKSVEAPKATSAPKG